MYSDASMMLLMLWVQSILQQILGVRKGSYNVTTPNNAHILRMEKHKNRWDRVVAKLNR
jgi:hypothetical protein